MQLWAGYIAAARAGVAGRAERLLVAQFFPKDDNPAERGVARKPSREDASQRLSRAARPPNSKYTAHGTPSIRTRSASLSRLDRQAHGNRASSAGRRKCTSGGEAQPTKQPSIGCSAQAS